MKILSTPLSRKLAAINNIEISQVLGTGPQGRILKADILNFLTKKQSNSEKKEEVQSKINSEKILGTRQKITPIRKAISSALKNSWNQVAYVNLVNEINVTRLWNLRKLIVEDVLQTEKVKLTFLPFVVKAVNLALEEFPIFGAKFDEKTQEIVFPSFFNIGIAVDTPHGLMVPVIEQPQSKSIIQIAKDINFLAKAAREKTIKPAQMQNGSFTITNYGSVGALFGVPVINFPEIAIAGIGSFFDKVIPGKNGFEVAKFMNLTIAADHRFVDGGDIGRFAFKIKQLLEKPELLGVY